MRSSDPLFVFGSWHPGFPRFKRLEPHLIESIAATVRGSLYRSRSGLPLFVNAGKDLIHGQLLQLSAGLDLAPTVPIDCVANGKLVKGQIFATLSERLPPGARKIPGGDWQTDLRRHPDLLSQLSPEQRLSLGRLRASNGQGLDPELYQQLLKLNLIVDSGRALHLSDLGHEVMADLELGAAH